MPFARIFAMTAALPLALTGRGGVDPALAPREVVTRVPPESAPPEPPEPPGPEPAPTRIGAGTGLDRFVAAVQAKLPGVALDRRDEEVEELGRQTCTALAAGKKPASVGRRPAESRCR